MEPFLSLQWSRDARKKARPPPLKTDELFRPPWRMALFLSGLFRFRLIDIDLGGGGHMMEREVLLFLGYVRHLDTSGWDHSSCSFCPTSFVLLLTTQIKGVVGGLYENGFLKPPDRVYHNVQQTWPRRKNARAVWHLMSVLDLGLAATNSAICGLKGSFDAFFKCHLQGTLCGRSNCILQTLACGKKKYEILYFFLLLFARWDIQVHAAHEDD